MKLVLLRPSANTEYQPQHLTLTRTFTFNARRARVVTRTHTRLKFKGHSVQKTEWKQMDRRKQAIALRSPLTLPNTDVRNCFCAAIRNVSYTILSNLLVHSGTTIATHSAARRLLYTASVRPCHVHED